MQTKPPLIKSAKNVHFIGIGGIGISTIAQILHEQGKTVTGSDMEDSDHIHHMQEEGIKISIGHNAKNITKDHDLVIYSFAIEKDNPELAKAKELNIQCITYPQSVGEFSKDYFTIAITGTHGKSTTTSMTALMLLKAGLDPTVIDGTKMKELGDKNYRLGKSKYLVVEACEFRDAFLNYKMDILATINVDSDHLDYFGTQEKYVQAFNNAAKKVEQNGLLIIDAEDTNSAHIQDNAKAHPVWITSNPENKFKKDYYYLEGNTLYFLEKENNKDEYSEQSLTLKPDVPGKFNIRNSVFTAIIGLFLKIPKEKIEEGIKAFKGSWRRMELKETNLKHAKFYDDYGHLAGEVDNTLKAIREKYPNEKILAVFQPHQFIRIKNYLKEFGECFEAADDVLIPDIQRNRDTKEQMASIQTPVLIDEIKKHKKNVFHSTDIGNTANWVREHGDKYDVIVAMGSGNIKKLYKLI
jgi:UDP-N-acetylmuramate--alanine ligase